MNGKISSLNKESNSGIIIGENGKKYSFNILDFKSNEQDLEIGINVSFIGKESFAKEVFMMKKAKKNILKTMIFIALFLIPLSMYFYPSSTIDKKILVYTFLASFSVFGIYMLSILRKKISVSLKSKQERPFARYS